MTVTTDRFDYDDFYTDDDFESFPRSGRSLDGLLVVALGLVVFMIFHIVKDRSVEKGNDSTQAEPVKSAQSNTIANIQQNPTLQKNEVELAIIVAPYDDYVITQGPHGASYGHKAIDIAAGKGAMIKSPIAGVVVDRYVDQYGNPTLVIENDYYIVTMLHGKYQVKVGDEVNLAQKVGKESNLGYTTDMQGRLCRGRNCGYHTHLNIFDKHQGVNINPLEVIGD